MILIFFWAAIKLERIAFQEAIHSGNDRQSQYAFDSNTECSFQSHESFLIGRKSRKSADLHLLRKIFKLVLEAPAFKEGFPPWQPSQLHP